MGCSVRTKCIVAGGMRAGGHPAGYVHPNGQQAYLRHRDPYRRCIRPVAHHRTADWSHRGHYAAYPNAKSVYHTHTAYRRATRAERSNGTHIPAVAHILQQELIGRTYCQAAECGSAMFAHQREYCGCTAFGCTQRYLSGAGLHLWRQTAIAGPDNHCGSILSADNELSLHSKIAPELHRACHKTERTGVQPVCGHTENQAYG